ncbi:MAG: NUDIX hydrolase [Mangrovicoccus sp.]
MAQPDHPPIRDAATIILLRGGPEAPSVLMGQRGSGAVFMPNKVVFPGGAVDPGDHAVELAGLPAAPCLDRLSEGIKPPLPQALLAAAIREVWEETGLILGRAGHWPDAPADWQGFAATGHIPDASALRFVFRAITPPGNKRRFDARFFLADASAACSSDLDDFSAASDELSNLQWIPLAEVRDFDLPFITQVVLAEIAVLLRDGAERPATVPFFFNDAEQSLFRRLNGRSPLAGNDA